jgi:hypothetical protein
LIEASRNDTELKMDIGHPLLLKRGLPIENCGNDSLKISILSF